MNTNKNFFASSTTERLTLADLSEIEEALVMIQAHLEYAFTGAHAPYYGVMTQEKDIARCMARFDVAIVYYGNILYHDAPNGYLPQTLKEELNLTQEDYGRIRVARRIKLLLQYPHHELTDISRDDQESILDNIGCITFPNIVWEQSTVDRRTALQPEYPLFIDDEDEDDLPF